MSAAVTAWGIVARDLTRSVRQRSRLVAGVARPFVWVLLVGVGFNSIARVGGGLSYHAYAYPGGVVMGALFGGMLTAISTVYDREFGMLRLMLASPSGAPALLAGRTISATLVGVLQGGIVLGCAPLLTGVGATEVARGLGALLLAAFTSATLGLLVAARLTSVENFGGVINVVLFPLLFVSGALYPTAGMPPPLRALARVNPVTYMVDLMRHAFGQPVEFTALTDAAAILATGVVAIAVAAALFDPEQRFIGRGRGTTADSRP
ncbi:MAG TPA: ABC transporter permease [Gemmatimonadales bacterium]|nr:ABC transporter permease [Gemmatimonadales bacterium]